MPYLTIYKSLGYKIVLFIVVKNTIQWDISRKEKEREKGSEGRKKKTEVLSGKSSSTDNDRLSEA